MSDEDAQLWLAASGAGASRVVVLDEDDWFMLEDAAGAARVLKEVQSYFARFVAPKMPWCRIACQTQPTAQSLAAAAAKTGAPPAQETSE